MNNQKGFTLIELIVVIVILGILSAFAIPKFVNFQGDARKSTVEGLAGSMRSAAALVHAKALATRTAAGNTVDVEGGTVTLDDTVTYPADTATVGIEAAIGDLSGFTIDAVTATDPLMFYPDNVTTKATCNVTYVPATPPTITVIVTNCD